MSTVFSDNFTEASNTALTSHTPSPTGTSWVEVAKVGTTINWQVYAADYVAGIGGNTAEGQSCKSQPDPSSSAYDVQWTVQLVDTTSGTQRRRLLGRMADSSNYYAAGLLPTAHASNTDELFKIVADAKTQLATVDTAWANNDTHMLRMRDAAKEVFRNGSSILSNSDNALTATGSAGIGLGNIGTNDTGNGNSNAFRFDDYLVDEATVSTSVINIHRTLLGVGV